MATRYGHRTVFYSCRKYDGWVSHSKALNCCVLKHCPQLKVHRGGRLPGRPASCDGVCKAY